MSDRLLGLLLAVFAVWYGITAREYTMDFTDPLGPSAFPQALAVPLGLLGVYLLVRPDPQPHWVGGWALVKQALTAAVLVGYGLVLEPLGFLLATAIGGALLAMLLQATWWQSLIAGTAISVSMFALFDGLLELPLPWGKVFGG